jgi:hypothetical protein
MATTSKARRQTLPPPKETPRKPMAVARRVSLFEREIRVKLSSAAIEILFGAASCLSEGQEDDGGFFGSVMVTIDLARAARLMSDPCDDSSARRIAELIATDPRVIDRARALATREAERLTGAPLGPLQIDLRTRRTGVQLHLDMDLEAPEDC